MPEKYSKGMIVPEKPKVPVPKVIPQKVSIKKKIGKEFKQVLDGLEKTIYRDKKKPYGYK